MAFNVVASVMIAMPYLGVAACCLRGWIAISTAHGALVAHTGLAGAVTWIVVMMRCLLLGVTLRLESLMIGLFPWLVREARDCLGDALEGSMFHRRFGTSSGVSVTSD
jgi:hypothetical protein